ncbi:hypothetical protein C4J81_18730 (plasmid) [Deltaproteobacteria bacterium Smac51]|nr:hypothetical protein C4J81_18730 [Deltaproteobacteria bacterium Smac51]
MKVDLISFDAFSGEKNDATAFTPVLGKNVTVFGTDERSGLFLEYIKNLDIKVDRVLSYGQEKDFKGHPSCNIDTFLAENNAAGLIVMLPLDDPDAALLKFIGNEPAEAWLCSWRTAFMFREMKDEGPPQIIEEPFPEKTDLPPIPVMVINTTFRRLDFEHEIIDFQNQRYITATHPQTPLPVSLSRFSTALAQDDLPIIGSTHLGYLLHQRLPHTTQLSPSRRFLVSQYYNSYYVTIVCLNEGRTIHWHDLDEPYIYASTGDFDDLGDNYYITRWPFKDSIEAIKDPSRTVRCQALRLNLETRQAEILGEFDFADRTHQVTISGDRRYLVFAPMRIFKPPVDPSSLSESRIMRQMRQWVPLDDMGTFDLKTGKFSLTRIPHPAPAHFELDPIDPHVFYVSTHSLVPYGKGVLVFGPGTIYRMRINDGIAEMEKTYTHPAFIRTIQHCSFLYRGQVLVAVTNQNKLEIIDGESMTAWHIHKFLEDSLYDEADFDNPDFLNRPYVLPLSAAHCNSISASADGEYLILRMPESYLIFSLSEKKVIGKLPFREGFVTYTHSRFYMQNASYATVERRYNELKERP